MSKLNHQIAVGWWKTTGGGEEYISASTNSKGKDGAQPIKLFAELPSGDTVQLTNFAVFQNRYKKEGTNQPDVQFVFTTGE